MKRFYFFLVLSLVCSLAAFAKDPSATLDVVVAADGAAYYDLDAVPNIKNLDWVGYNSTGSGTGGDISESHWKLSSSRTITFKVTNCSKVRFDQAYFNKDAETIGKYSINGGEEVYFITNGTTKKGMYSGEFETGNTGEITILITATNEFVINHVYFYPAVTTAPVLNAFTFEGVVGTIDQASPAIYLSLPYGTTPETVDRTNYTYALGGTATTATVVIYADLSGGKVTVSDGTNEVEYNIYITIPTTDPNYVCGEFIRATHTNKTTADLSGEWAGSATVDKNTQGNGKLGSNGHYFGIILNDGRSFQAGDVLNVNIDEASVSARLEVFSDKGITKIAEKTEGVAAGDNYLTIPVATNMLYVYRTEEANSNMNPAVAFLAVTRDCEAKLTGFSIAGITAVIDDEAHTVTAELPNGTVLTDEDWNNAYTVNAATTSVVYNAEHTTLTLNGELVYTLNITVAASLSTNANLSAIKVNGTAIAGFRADSLNYNYVIAYNADALPVITAETEDITATAVVEEITSETQLVNITVTAQDGVTVLVYTVQLSKAAAPKELKEVILSNGFSAYQMAGAETVEAYYLAGSAVPTIQSVVVNEGATYAVNGNVITVTGSDNTTMDYTVNIQAVSPAAYTEDVIVFDGTEAYVKTGNAWNETNGYVFSKNDTDYSREWAGKNRIYMFLPACDTITLTEGGKNKRNIIVLANNVQVFEGELPKDGSIKVAVEQSASFMLEVRSNQTSGDGSVKSIQMKHAEGVVVPPTPDPVYPTGITLNETAKTLEIGETLTLTATLAPQNVDADKTAITWTSSNETVATVAEGVVTAVAAGEAVITATTVNGLTATCTVTVNAKEEPQQPEGLLNITTEGIYYADGIIYNPQGVTIQLYNAAGQLLTTANTNINLNAQPSAIYILRTTNHTVKILK